MYLAKLSLRIWSARVPGSFQPGRARGRRAACGGCARTDQCGCGWEGVSRGGVEKDGAVPRSDVMRHRSVRRVPAHRLAEWSPLRCDSDRATGVYSPTANTLRGPVTHSFGRPQCAGNSRPKRTGLAGTQNVSEEPHQSPPAPPPTVSKYLPSAQYPPIGRISTAPEAIALAWPGRPCAD